MLPRRDDNRALAWGWSPAVPDLRRSPSWITARACGALVGLAGVALITATDYFFSTYVFEIPSPILTYVLPILAIAYVWGWRVGALTAVAAFLATWYFLLPRQLSWELSEPGEYARLTLGATTFAALVVVGDALSRLGRSNAQLARTVERLDTIILSIADGVLITDGVGHLLQANEAMRRMLGGAEVPRTPAAREAIWQPRRADGTPFPSGTDPLACALAGEVVTGTETIVRNAAGEDVRLSVSAAPLRPQGEAIVGAVVICRDVTELRRLQQIKDDFLSVASHELKTPLTALKGYIELLRKRFERGQVVDDRSRRYLTVIEGQMQRVHNLVDTLLDVSRLEAGRLRLRPGRFDLIALVRHVVGEAAGLSQRHLFAVEVNPGTPAIEGDWDRDRIEQVLVNLLSNAVRYSPDGGSITVTVGLFRAGDDAGGDGARPASVYRGSAPDRQDAAFVRVRDSGLGLPPEQLPLVFERFHQAHEDAVHRGTSGGMGLGLYISREIVDRHGGRIWAESDGPGRGAAFTFTLPLTPVPAASVAPAQLG